MIKSVLVMSRGFNGDFRSVEIRALRIALSPPYDIISTSLNNNFIPDLYNRCCCCAHRGE